MIYRPFLLLTMIYISGCTSHTRIVDYYETNMKKTEEIRKGKGENSHVTKRIIYFENGRIQSEQLIKKGRLSGRAIFYHQNGEIATTGVHLNGLRSGIWEWTNSKGVADSTHRYKNGKLHGKTKYFVNGDLNSVHYYQKGKRHGKFKEYYAGGNLKVTGQYFENLPHGLWIWYDIHKLKAREVTFSKGIKHGEFKIWNENRLVLSGQFELDKRTGLWKWGRDKKNLDSIITYNDNIPDGKFKAWHSNGILASKGNFLGGKNDGSWEWWSSDGLMDSSKVYKRGQLNGISQFYFKNSKLKSSYIYVDGNLDGESISYFPSGEIKGLTTYKKGKKTGPYEVWYSASVPEEKGAFIKNKMNGKIKRWYSNGGLASISNYSEGKPNGITQIFALSGQITKELFFVDGSEVGRFDYHNNGRFKRVKIIENGKTKFERQWNDLGLEITKEESVIGTRLVSEFYLSGFIKYECTFKNDQKHGMEWWFNENQSPTQIILHLNGQEIVRHKIAYESSK